MKLVDSIAAASQPGANFVMDATPLPEPVNPWAWLAEQLAEQDIDGLGEAEVEALRRILRSYRTMARGCELTTQNRLVIYTLGECLMAPEAAQAVLGELRRVVAWQREEASVEAPRPARRRRLGDEAPAEGEAKAGGAS